MCKVFYIMTIYKVDYNKRFKHVEILVIHEIVQQHYAKRIQHVKHMLEEIK